MQLHRAWGSEKALFARRRLPGPRAQRDPQGARAVAAKDLLYTEAKCNLGDTATIYRYTGVRVSRFRLSARLLGLLGGRQEGHRVDGMQRAAICARESKRWLRAVRQLRRVAQTLHLVPGSFVDKLPLARP